MLNVKEITSNMLGVVCHDAGGAELVSSWLKKNKIKFLPCLEGPAISIFEKKFNDLNIMPVETMLERSEAVLIGTGWQTKFEVDALELAKKRHIKTFAYLDHWVNFTERFVTKRNKICLPDEIWVGDEFALKIARDEFSDQKIRFVKNCFFEEIDIKNKKNIFVEDVLSSEVKVLYVCEPILDHLKEKGDELNLLRYNEYEAIEYFLENISKLNMNVGEIQFRPHPSEDPEKYINLLNVTKYKISISKEPTIEEHISDFDVIVGCESMAMVVGVLMGKKVISVIPPKGRKCVLPHANIIHLRDLINAN